MDNLKQRYVQFQRKLSKLVVKETNNPYLTNKKNIFQIASSNVKELFYQTIIMLTSYKIWYLLALILAIFIYRKGNKMDDILFYLFGALTLVTIYRSITYDMLIRNILDVTLNVLIISYKRKAPEFLYRMYLVKEILLFIFRLTTTSSAFGPSLV